MTSMPLDLARTLALKADHDIQAVELLMDEGATDVICFHLQQAAEKILKAYLQANSIEFLVRMTWMRYLIFALKPQISSSRIVIASKYLFPMLSCFVTTWTMSRPVMKRVPVWCSVMKSAQV
jgi:hypothetical protein